MQAMGKPQIHIVEQPSPKPIRFRYDSEIRTSTPVLGERSEAKKKTYPSIKISGYEGDACIIVSCVEENPTKNKHGVERYR